MDQPDLQRADFGFVINYGSEYIRILSNDLGGEITAMIFQGERFSVHRSFRRAPQSLARKHARCPVLPFGIVEPHARSPDGLTFKVKCGRCCGHLCPMSRRYKCCRQVIPAPSRTPRHLCHCLRQNHRPLLSRTACPKFRPLAIALGFTNARSKVGLPERRKAVSRPAPNKNCVPTPHLGALSGSE